ncbi:hypothetical protein DPMN_137728 [Dreissena polymorpha]|uniref:Uncharacterized protein n=1 Tax=Dreissena polymorpha TaxID=45954 RepID=A0A9D4G693_DREPO|nr:hypothetical protein DPMN_137703 [Dreissena polymorpha]KAH3809365.1 hypothetical protein DPMN_137728 [Dreissena polymorpha]
MDLLPVRACAVVAADEHPQARLLEDHSVVVVRIAHGPAAYVTPRVLAFLVVHVPAAPVWPLPELLQLVELGDGICNLTIRFP